MKDDIALPNQAGESPPTSLPFKVRRHGRINRWPYHSTLGTHHGDAMLTLVVGGWGVYRRGNRSQRIGAGMVGIVMPTDSPGILLADAKDPYDHFYCRFSGYEAITMAGRISAQHGDDAFFDFAGWHPLADAFHRLLDWPPGDDADSRLCPADTMLAHLLTLIERPETVQVTVECTESQLIRYMREHMSDSADLAMMARHFNITKEHLCRIAKPVLGTTILKKWTAMKMEWAEVLLQDDSFAVRDVARLVGYDNPLYFSTVFKKRNGMSPSQFRRLQP